MPVLAATHVDPFLAVVELGIGRALAESWLAGAILGLGALVAVTSFGFIVRMIRELRRAADR